MFFKYIPLNKYERQNEDAFNKYETFRQTLNQFTTTVLNPKHASVAVTAILWQLSSYFKVTIEEINWEDQVPEDVLRSVDMNSEEYSMIYKDLLYLLWKSKIIPLVVVFNNESKKEILNFLNNNNNQLSLVLLSEKPVNVGKTFNNISEIGNEQLLLNILKTVTVSLQGKEGITLKQAIEENDELLKKITPNLYTELISNYVVGGDEKFPGYQSRKIKVPVLHKSVFEETDNFFITDDDSYVNVAENQNSNVVSTFLSIEETLKQLKNETRSKHFLKKLYEDYYQVKMSIGSIAKLKNHLTEEKIAVTYENSLYETNVPIQILYGQVNSGKTWFLKHMKKGGRKHQFNAYLNVNDNLNFLNNCNFTDDSFVQFLTKLNVPDDDFKSFADVLFLTKMKSEGFLLLLDDYSPNFTKLDELLKLTQEIKAQVWIGTTDQSIEEKLHLLPLELLKMSDAPIYPMFDQIPINLYKRLDLNHLQRDLMIKAINQFTLTTLPEQFSSVMVSSMLKTVSNFFNFKLETIKWDDPVPKHILDIIYVTKRADFENLVTSGEALIYKDLLYLVWRLKIIPLVIEYDQKFEEDIKDFTASDLSLVILKKEETNVQFQDTFTNLSEIKNIEVLKQILEGIIVATQDKCPLKIEELLDEQVLKKITPKVFVLLMTRSVNFHDDFEAVKYYVPRKFTVPVLKKSTIVNLPGKFIIENEEGSEILPSKPANNNEEIVLKQLDDYCEVISSTGNITYLLEHLVKDELSCRYEENILASSSPLVLFYGPSGFGRTTFFKQMQRKIKEEQCSIYINANEHLEILNNLDYNGDSLIDFLLSFDIKTEEVKHFAKVLLCKRLKEDKVLVFLDDCNENFIKLKDFVNSCKRLKIKLWVGTKRGKLQEDLECLAVEMLPFDETDQILFLENFYKYTEEDEERRDELLTKIVKNQQEVLCEIFGHPIIIKTLAEIFEFISDFDKDTISSFFVDNDEINDKSDVIRWFLSNRENKTLTEAIRSCEEIDILEKLVDVLKIDLNYTDIYNRSLVLEVVESKNVEVFKFLLEREVSLTDRDLRNGRTMFHVCASKGCVKIANLIKDKYLVNLEDYLMKIPIFYAVEGSKSDMAKWLIIKGSDLKKKDKDGNTILHKVAENDLEEVAEILIKKQVDVNAQNNNKETPLFLSILAGTSITSILLQNKADVNVQNKNGYSVVHLLSMTNNVGLAQQLLENGADLNLVDNKGRSAVYLALETKNQKMFDLLSKTSGNLLKQATLNSNVDLIKSLITEHNLNVDEEDDHGEPPILHALNNNKPEVVKLLIEHGANLKKHQSEIVQKIVSLGFMELMEFFNQNLTFKDDQNRSLLFFAVLNNKEDMVKWLIDNGAPTDTKDSKFDYGLLHLSASLGHMNITKMLLNHCDVNELNKKHESPLSLAVRFQQPEIVLLLLENNADINWTNPRDKMTLLHLCSCTGNTRILQILLENNLDVNARDVTNWTPLFYAIDYKYVEAVQFLLENGADILVKDSRNGRNVLHRIAEHGTAELFKDCFQVDWNCLDDFGFTPLTLAIVNNRTCTTYLMEKGTKEEISV